MSWSSCPSTRQSHTSAPTASWHMQVPGVQRRLCVSVQTQLFTRGQGDRAMRHARSQVRGQAHMFAMHLRLAIQNHSLSTTCPIAFSFSFSLSLSLLFLSFTFLLLLCSCALTYDAIVFYVLACVSLPAHARAFACDNLCTQLCSMRKTRSKCCTLESRSCLHCTSSSSSSSSFAGACLRCVEAA